MRKDETRSFASLTIAIGAAIAGVISAAWDASDFLDARWIWVALSVVGAGVSALLSVDALRKKEAQRERRQVFIVYDRRDIEKARIVAQWLTEQGYSPWLDVEMIQPGTEWRKAISDALHESGAALVIVTENLTQPAKWIELEIRQAASNLRSRDTRMSPIIPVVMTEADAMLDFQAIPGALGGIQAVTFSSEQDRAHLREGLQRILGDNR